MKNAAWRVGIGLSFLACFLSWAPFLFAGGLDGVKTAGKATVSGVRQAVRRALEPGTFPRFEQFVQMLGSGLDFYFDLLVQLAQRAKISPSADSFVNGFRSGFDESGFNVRLNRALDFTEKFVNSVGIKPLVSFLNADHAGIQPKVQPYFKAGFDFTDNVFKEPNPDREDVLWTYTPGVAINLPAGKLLKEATGKEDVDLTIGAVYEARILRYTKFEYDDDIGQSFGARADLKLNDRLYASVDEEFVKDAARPGTIKAKRVEYTDQKVSPLLGTHWREWTVEAQYDNAHRRFGSAIYDRFEYDQNTITGRVYRNLAPNFRGLIEYNFSAYDYDHDVTRPGRYHQIRGGVAGALSSRTHVSAKVGYMDRSYHKDDTTEFDKPVAEVRLAHQLTKRTGLDFYFYRTANESSFTDNRYSDDKRITAAGRHLFTSKLRGRAGGSYIGRDFEATARVGRVVVKRKDAGYDLFAGLDYALRPWMMLSAEYRHERSNSNVSDFDFTANTLSLDLTMPL